MTFCTYKTTQELNQAIREHSLPETRETAAYADLLTRIRKLLGSTVVLGVNLSYTCILKPNPQEPWIKRPLLTVFRKKQVDGKAILRPVACFDVMEHDVNQEWSDTCFSWFGPRLRKAGIAYVQITPAHLKDEAYVSSTEFKRRIRRAAFSDRFVKYKPFPNLPYQPKRVTRGSSCRSRTYDSPTTGNTSAPSSNSDPASAASLARTGQGSQT